MSACESFKSVCVAMKIEYINMDEIFAQVLRSWWKCGDKIYGLKHIINALSEKLLRMSNDVLECKLLFQKTALELLYIGKGTK